jgi:hypothetical protein
MNLKDFAGKRRLRLKSDECGDMNVMGKRGDIYEYGSGWLAATILRAPNGLHWNKYRIRAKAAGCRITQNGDTEGTFLFEPENEEQAKLAIEAIRPRFKKKVTPETLRRLAELRRSNAVLRP